MSDKASNTSSSWVSRPVFISSTFKDMQAERDHLNKVVFPELVQYMEEYRDLPKQFRDTIRSKEQSEIKNRIINTYYSHFKNILLENELNSTIIIPLNL